MRSDKLSRVTRQDQAPRGGGEVIPVVEQDWSGAHLPTPHLCPQLQAQVHRRLPQNPLHFGPLQERNVLLHQLPERQVVPRHGPPAPRCPPMRVSRSERRGRGDLGRPGSGTPAHAQPLPGFTGHAPSLAPGPASLKPHRVPPPVPTARTGQPRSHRPLALSRPPGSWLTLRVRSFWSRPEEPGGRTGALAPPLPRGRHPGNGALLRPQAPPPPISGRCRLVKPNPPRW